MKVSVVVATYNSLNHLSEQLKSIVAQTRPADQIVITDDGSSDDTLDLVGKLLVGVPAEVIILSGRVGGVVANVNRGLAAATGDLVATADHDDIWLPGKLGAAVSYFERHPGTTLWFSNAGLVDETGAELASSLWERYLFTNEQQKQWERGDPWGVLVKKSVVTGATAVWSRRVVEAAVDTFPAGAWHDEWLTLLACALGIAHPEPRPQMRYRLHANNSVGVPPRSARQRIRRLLDGQAPDRLASERWRALLAHPSAPAIGQDHRRQVQEKAAFALARGTLPLQRRRRVGPVLALAMSGGYRRFDDGWRTAANDLAKRWALGTTGS